MSFPVHGEKINLGHFEARRTKSPKFTPKLGIKSGKIERLDNFVWGIRKNWSRDDLSIPQIPGYEVYPENHS